MLHTGAHVVAGSDPTSDAVGELSSMRASVYSPEAPRPGNRDAPNSDSGLPELDARRGGEFGSE